MWRANFSRPVTLFVYFGVFHCACAVSTTLQLPILNQTPHLNSGQSFSYIGPIDSATFFHMYSLNYRWAKTHQLGQIAHPLQAFRPNGLVNYFRYSFLTTKPLTTRSSANAEGPCEHIISWNRIKCCTNVRRIAFEKHVNDLQGHSKLLPLLPFDRPYSISY